MAKNKSGAARPVRYAFPQIDDLSKITMLNDSGPYDDKGTMAWLKSQKVSRDADAIGELYRDFVSLSRQKTRG